MSRRAEDAGALCVAIVGPPNSGKSAFLELLNDWLQDQPEVLAYVLPANPDGVGKYLQHSRELRALLKTRIKGYWDEGTVATLVHWVTSAKSHLDLVLLDCGGKISAENDEILRHCSHYILLVREDATCEGEDWQSACEARGLRPLAILHSTITGDPIIRLNRSGLLEGVSNRKREASGTVVEEVGKKLLVLAPRREAPPYVDLNRRRPWSWRDLEQLEALPELKEACAAEGPLLLGGANAPVWAYAAAMHLGLDRRPGRDVRVFEPKIQSGWVEISGTSGTSGESPLSEYLDVRWVAAPEGEGVTLDVGLRKRDRLLPFGAERLLDQLPVPADDPPPLGPVVLCGRLPIWAQLAYSRWLRERYEGRTLGVWDGRTQMAVLVHGPGSPNSIPWVVPEAVGDE